MSKEIILALKERAKEMLENNYDRKIGDEELYTIICEWENLYKEVKEYYIPKSVIREKIDKRQFELQQEHKDFRDDIRLNTLQEIYYEGEEE